MPAAPPPRIGKYPGGKPTAGKKPAPRKMLPAAKPKPVLSMMPAPGLINR